MSNDNPWEVSDASVFLKYCCPECDYQCSQLDSFGIHATKNHDLSSILFEETKGSYISNLFSILSHLYQNGWNYWYLTCLIDLLISLLRTWHLWGTDEKICNFWWNMLKTSLFWLSLSYFWSILLKLT